MNFEWVDQSVHITDARDNKEDFTLHRYGFTYCDDPEGGTPEMLDVLRENNLEKVRQMYYPHIDNLARRETGPSRVVIFDHTSRKRRPELGTYDNPTGKKQPATMVHCDQSTKGALRRMEQNVPGNIHEILQKRVIMIKFF